MRRIQAIALVVFVALTGACRTSPNGEGAPASGTSATTLTVFAAASLTESFKEIGTAFGKENGGATVTFNFGGSQQLAQQLGQGAAADVFASANEKQMTAAVDAGRIEKDTARAFVRNRLVVVVPKENPGHVASVDDLSKPGLKLVLAAKEVPVGQYGLEVLDRAEKAGKAGFKDAVLKNVVSYEQDVKTVLAKVVLGEADAGIVYTSDVSPDSKDKVSRVEIPEPLNVVASYPIAVVKDSAHAELAKKFVDYVRSPAGQAVLVAHGFTSTTGDATGAAPGAVPVAVSGKVKTPIMLAAGDLTSLPHVDAPDGAGTASGVAITAILDKAGLDPSAANVALVGGDGYRKELTLAELRADAHAIVTVAENGSLRSVVPSKGPGYSVKGLVKIEVT